MNDEMKCERERELNDKWYWKKHWNLITNSQNKKISTQIEGQTEVIQTLSTKPTILFLSYFNYIPIIAKCKLQQC